MYIINENEREYRFGDSGPKYLMKGPRMNFAIVQFMPGPVSYTHLDVYKRQVALSATPFPPISAGSTQLLSAPLVPISTSMLGMSFGMIRSSLSRPAVEPIK